jgi:hypothetical protein
MPRLEPLTLITTGRLDAVLHEPPPQRTWDTIGRPRVKGLRLPALDQVLQNPETVWQHLTVNWYGEGKRMLQICDFHGAVVPLWIRSLTHPLGAHTRSSWQASSKSHLFHGSGPTSRRDDPGLYETLEPGSHL